MAAWDSPDLLARFQREGGIPSTAAFPASTDIYAWLTEAEAHWKLQIANHCPGILGWTTATLTSSDGGLTYPMPGTPAAYPLAVEVYSNSTGRFLVPGWYPDSSADYVWEGDRIRVPRGATRTWSGGPYVRYVTAPGTIDASTESTIFPKHARMLIVWRALVFYATRGGMRDPRPYLAGEERLWMGDGKTDGGLLLWMKQQNAFAGEAAVHQSRSYTTHEVHQIEGYSL